MCGVEWKSTLAVCKQLGGIVPGNVHKMADFGSISMFANV